MGMLEDLLAGAMSGGADRARPPSTSGGINSGALAALLPVVLAMLANRGRAASPGAGGALGDMLGQVLGGGRASGGGLGDILGQVLGGGAGGNGGDGGLGGLLEKLNRGGYGQQANSWVGSGQNMSLPSGAIRDIFGQGGLSAIARQAGLSEQDASDGLAQLLPEVVNRVTPQGRVPDDGDLHSTLEGLLRQLSR